MGHSTHRRPRTARAAGLSLAMLAAALVTALLPSAATALPGPGNLDPAFGNQGWLEST